MACTMRWLMAKPSPVPPRRRERVLSTWWKGWKTCVSDSGAMPMPVSSTTKRTPARPSGADSAITCRRTSPFSVNFTPLPTRFSSTCLSRGASPTTASAASGSSCSVTVSPRPSALARNSDVADATTHCKDIGVSAICSLPASILEWSSTSFKMSIRDSPDADAVLTSRRWRCSSGVWRSNSSAPSTPFIGVRISWLMVARNCDLARLADSAASLAR